MDEDFNVYCSDWLYGFGQFVVITTSQYIENGKDIRAEVFVFAGDTDTQVKCFKAKVINYKAKAETQGIVNIDLEFMKKEALRRARILIYQCQWAEYDKTKNKDLIDRTFQLEPCDKLTLIEIDDYDTELKFIKERTKSEGLKQYISTLLSLPKLEIEEIE